MTYSLRYAGPACATTQAEKLRHNTLQEVVPQQKLRHETEQKAAIQQPHRTLKLAYSYLYFALQE